MALGGERREHEARRGGITGGEMKRAKCYRPQLRLGAMSSCTVAARTPTLTLSLSSFFLFFFSLPPPLSFVCCVRPASRFFYLARWVLQTLSRAAPSPRIKRGGLVGGVLVVAFCSVLTNPPKQEKKKRKKEKEKRKITQDNRTQRHFPAERRMERTK